MNSAQRLVEAYLADLEDAARPLSRLRRAELRADIEAHLAESLPPDADAATVRDELERLGRPDEIVAAELPARRAKGTGEWAAMVLLPSGGFLAGIGWLVGVICLWGSPMWGSRDKWAATLLVPFGLALPFYAVLIFGTDVCADDGCPERSAEDWVGLAAVVWMVFAQIYSVRRLAQNAR